MQRASAICSLGGWISHTHGDHYLPTSMADNVGMRYQPPNEQIADAYCV